MYTVAARLFMNIIARFSLAIRMNVHVSRLVLVNNNRCTHTYTVARTECGGGAKQRTSELAGRKMRGVYFEPRSRSRSNTLR